MFGLGVMTFFQFMENDDVTACMFWVANQAGGKKIGGILLQLRVRAGRREISAGGKLAAWDTVRTGRSDPKTPRCVCLNHSTIFQQLTVFKIQIGSKKTSCS